jgi:TatD DNase family protein
MFIDTHAHLDFSKFDDDRDAVIARARENGVEKIVNITSDGRDFEKVAGIAADYDNIWQSIGLHPHSTAVLSDPNWLDRVRKFAQGDKVVAIGEVGLDYYEMTSSKKEQIDLLEPQLDLAREMELPVILHIRESYDDVYEAVQDERLVGVVHCFSGNQQQAEKFLELGYMISFTNIITFPKTEELARVVKFIPLERIMLETDCPFLAPQRLRGERCEPSYVRDVAAKIAEIKEVPVAEIAAATTRNAEKFFKI